MLRCAAKRSFATPRVRTGRRRCFSFNTVCKSESEMLEQLARPMSRLWIQKLQDGFCVFLVQRCSYAHMTADCSRDRGRETFRCSVTAGTILIEFLCAITRL